MRKCSGKEAEDHMASTGIKISLMYHMLKAGVDGFESSCSIWYLGVLPTCSIVLTRDCSKQTRLLPQGVSIFHSNSQTSHLENYCQVSH